MKTARLTHWIVFFLVCLAVGGIGLRASADGGPGLEEQIAEKSGMDEVLGSLDKGTRTLLSQWGGDELAEGISAEKIFHSLCGMVQEKLTGPLKACAALVGILVLSRLAGCMGEGEPSGAAALLGCLACGVVIAPHVLGLVTRCGAAAESASAFLLASVPAYAALLSASGSVTAGGSYSLLTLGAGNLLPLLTSGVLLPLLRVFMALSVSACVSGVKVQKLASSLYSFTKWLLLVAVTLFSGILSVQTILNTHMDAAANKAVKLITSSAIPIVGGALGDALGAIQSSVQVVRSGAGAFGVLAALCIFAPAMIEAALWAGVCTLGQIAADLCDVSPAASLLGACASAVKLVLAVLCSLCVVCLTCAGVVLFVKGG